VTERLFIRALQRMWGVFAWFADSIPGCTNITPTLQVMSVRYADF
jgi:hypothetical protein